MVIVCDTREPIWVQRLTFKGASVSTQYLDHGDLMIACDDGTMMVIERKTPDDFLGSLKDGRLFSQLAPLPSLTRWAYLMITGDLQQNHEGKIVTARGATGWRWVAIQGALLSIQELGVMVTYCAGDTDYENAILRLIQRDHSAEKTITPIKQSRVLSIEEQIIAQLPGVGFERLDVIMAYAENSPAVALELLTDLTKKIPDFPDATKKRIRRALGLSDNALLKIVKEKTNE